MAGLLVGGDSLDVMREVLSDRFESEPRMLVLGARGQGLADGIGNNIDLRVAAPLSGRPFGEGNDAVTEQLDAVPAVDLARRESPLLLGKSE